MDETGEFIIVWIIRAHDGGDLDLLGRVPVDVEGQRDHAAAAVSLLHHHPHPVGDHLAIVPDRSSFG